MSNDFQLLIGGSAAAAGMPPVDPGSDSDQDHPQHEPRFMIHAVDDARRRPPPPALLPIQHRPGPALVAAAMTQEQRLQRLGFFLIMPQGLLCFWNVYFGGVMIYLVKNPGAVTNVVGWMIGSSALIIFFSLVSFLLSLLAVYCYDGWPAEVQ